MQQSQFDGIVTFIAVAEERSFSLAASKLGVSPSAVSQTIRNLERRAGVALFSRNTRGVSLTEIGEQYFNNVLPAVRALSAASEELGASSGKVAGTLRLNMARAGYMTILKPVLRRFVDNYPEISIEICVDGSLTDIVGLGFDAGIRFGNLVQKDMVAVRVGPPISAHVIASPEYLARKGVPMHPRDLVDHDCIGFRHVTSGQVERWKFSKAEEEIEIAVNGKLLVNDSAVLVQCAVDGIGIAYMINGYIEGLIHAGRLARILDDWSPSLPGFTLYYPDRRSVAPKLRALIDFLRADPQLNASGQEWLFGVSRLA
ncbi:DNA-binding transcriptional LysR family regulator [Paraburkholderia silvatlantica]|uniref:DNA-binding transcriptional LysR family regulator n=1 Tax=Paraburkholderia silvatlantica TaxID=321895 RepID=A0A2V4U4S3_9BURK|nr:LysR family transcriptional regulator [Paraburkholderia silvatlantica]PYE25452.1 DNA-binding transcriptional LysR family regulator [Paraburkholderia silvatlantica]